MSEPVVEVIRYLPSRDSRGSWKRRMSKPSAYLTEAISLGRAAPWRAVAGGLDDPAQRRAARHGTAVAQAHAGSAAPGATVGSVPSSDPSRFTTPVVAFSDVEAIGEGVERDTVRGLPATTSLVDESQANESTACTPWAASDRLQHAGAGVVTYTRGPAVVGRYARRTAPGEAATRAGLNGRLPVARVAALLTGSTLHSESYRRAAHHDDVAGRRHGPLARPPRRGALGGRGGRRRPGRPARPAHDHERRDRPPRRQGGSRRPVRPS